MQLAVPEGYWWTGTDAEMKKADEKIDLALEAYRLMETLRVPSGAQHTPGVATHLAASIKRCRKRLREIAKKTAGFATRKHGVS